MTSSPTPGQEAISGDKPGVANLVDQSCEWCGPEEPARHALPIMRKMKGGKAGAVMPTGTFVYCCDKHKKIAEESNPGKELTEMNDSFDTVGERLLERKLERELRQGVDHYKGGQHRATIVEEDVCLWATLGFIDVLGAAVLMLCKTNENGDWEPVAGTFMRAGLTMSFGARPLPDDYVLSDKGIAALKEAEERWKVQQKL